MLHTNLLYWDFISSTHLHTKNKHRTIFTNLALNILHFLQYLKCMKNKKTDNFPFFLLLFFLFFYLEKAKIFNTYQIILSFFIAFLLSFYIYFPLLITNHLIFPFHKNFSIMYPSWIIHFTSFSLSEIYTLCYIYIFYIISYFILFSYFRTNFSIMPT